MVVTMTNSSTIAIKEILPDKLNKLAEIAYNYWWCWNPEGRELFKTIDPIKWEQSKHNPIKLLKELGYKKLAKLESNENYIKQLEKTYDNFKTYMDFIPHYSQFSNKVGSTVGISSVAYFSAEFAIHESLPMYAGGLGVLAGDFLKSSSDLGLPVIGIGLLYRRGYIQQEITSEGKQKSQSPFHDFSLLPIETIKDEKNEDLMIKVDMADSIVNAKVWRVNIGRSVLYLLDTDHNFNDKDNKQITMQLYGGDDEMRLRQEILLGIGGVEALRKLNLSPDIYHINEGHAAFLVLERAKQYMLKKSVTFGTAIKKVVSNNVFTTHTPVDAGHDEFSKKLMKKYFNKFCKDVNLTLVDLMKLGKSEGSTKTKNDFNMTVLALKTSGYRNGVSELHGRVSRHMWSHVWNLDGEKSEKTPIIHVTNGVHPFSWTAPELVSVYDKYMGGDWRGKLALSRRMTEIQKIPDKVLWNTHLDLKHNLLDFTYSNIKKRIMRNMMKSSEPLCQPVIDELNPHALTIGFARRFTPYKRATLLFNDLERFKKILSNVNKPIQFIFAGKAHPMDFDGQKMIAEICKYSSESWAKGKIFFIEDYDMLVSSNMIFGVDVWLNNPLKPLEACGTSGQKVAMNGGLNFSIMDGWWREAYNGKNGWAIGKTRKEISTPLKTQQQQDQLDVQMLYDLLEFSIIPTFFSRNENNLPLKWISMMKNAISTIMPVFNTDRMVMDYFTKLYEPAFFDNKDKSGSKKTHNINVA